MQESTVCKLDAQPQLRQLDMSINLAQCIMQVQQEALTEEEVALLHPVQPVQLCLQPRPNAVLCVPMHCGSGHNVRLL